MPILLIAVALTVLAVAPTGRGGTKATGDLVGAIDPLERAVYGVLHDPIGLRAIRVRKRVIEATADTGRRLVRAGLLLSTGRWLLYRLTAFAVLATGLAGLIVDAPATSSMAAFTAVATETVRTPTTGTSAEGLSESPGRVVSISAGLGRLWGVGRP